MDEAIYCICNALGAGASVDDIHAACAEKGWPEEDIFFAVKAAELLLKTIIEKEAEMKKRSAPFGRK